MSIQLEPAETILRDEIIERIEKVRKSFAVGQIGDRDRKAIQEAGDRAHKLHMLLKGRGFEPKHHAYMIKNRELQPDDPGFYLHFHPIEDLLKFLDNEHANDDPLDQTLGAEFEFTVNARWGAPNVTYRVTRTESGWDIYNPILGGPCDTGGCPHLFQNFDIDFVIYPSKLDWYFAWLWNQAKDKGLTYDEVQHALQELANWVTQTGLSAPTYGVWEGFL